MELEPAVLLTVLVVDIAAVDIVVVVVASLLIVIADFDFSAMVLATLAFVNRRLVTRPRRCWSSVSDAVDGCSSGRCVSSSEDSARDTDPSPSLLSLPLPEAGLGSSRW